jgi:hypothetical protein
MTNFKNLNKAIETNVKSIQRDFQAEPAEIGKPRTKISLDPMDISKVPKEQRDKLESYIKQWENPSKWYECKMEGLEWFLKVAQKNNATAEEVEFVIEKNSKNQPILKPMVKNRDLTEKITPKMDDMNRLRKFLKQYPQYKSRVENGENVADMAISIIKEYLEKEERRNLGLGI